MIGSVLLAVVLGGPAHAAGDERKEVVGVLVDQKCARFYLDALTELPSHGKRCVTACKESGYGVMVGKDYLAFNAQGNRVAEQWLARTSRESNLRVVVVFRLERGAESHIVESISDAPE